MMFTLFVMPTAVRASTTPQQTMAMNRAAGVGLRVALYLDRSRNELDYLTGHSTLGRRILTEIRYPTSLNRTGETQDAPPLIGAAPYPMIVFAQGYNTKPDLYRSLLNGWVRAGYVVVAPEFPDTTYPTSQAVMNAGDPHGSPENDIVNEPADLSFVISTVTRYSAIPSSFLFGLVDPKRVLLVGHSDGASVVGAYVFDRDVASNLASIRGVAIFAGNELSPDPYGEPPARAVPAFVAQSSGDT